MSNWRGGSRLVIWACGVAAVLAAWQLPVEGTCCENTPKQCEAASVCYDNGFCLSALNMCKTSDNKCIWAECDRSD